METRKERMSGKVESGFIKYLNLYERLWLINEEIWSGKRSAQGANNLLMDRTLFSSLILPAARTPFNRVLLKLAAPVIPVKLN